MFTHRFKNRLVVVAVFALLAVIGTLMNSGKVKAQGPPGGMAVNIVNPLPVPITGSTTVSGTVAAKVENTPTTAVPTVAAPAASQLYSSSCSVGFNNGFGACDFNPPPAGQTLFIETASIFSTSPPGADPAYAFISSGPGILSGPFIPMVQQAPVSGFDTFVGALAGRIWVNAGVTPICEVTLGGNGSSMGGIKCYISGYLAPAQ